MINRSQALVLVFFVAAVVTAVVIAAVAPETFGTPPPGAILVPFLVALGAFLVLATIGVLRRWRWLYWLVVLAFLAGVLRVPATILELNHVLPRQGPDWYLLLQAAIGLVQFGIGLLLLRGYRRAGVWGSF